MFKQKYHLIGALVHGRGMWVYTMSHAFPADPNVTIEVLQRVLTDLSKESGGALPPRLCLQLDNCVRENKNKALMAYLSWLVLRKVFTSVEVSFLPVGHTHEDIDQVWSRTGIQMRVNDVCCEEELFAIIRDAFTHCGLKPRCGALKSMANIKDWLLEHCEDVHGLSGREILHFKIEAHKGQPVVFTKHRSNLSWSEPGHAYETESKGFHLLHKNTPCPPFKAEVSKPCPLVPNAQSATVLHNLQKALTACQSDARVSASAYTWLTASLAQLRNTSELHFDWPCHGQLLCEQVQEYSQPLPFDPDLDPGAVSLLEADADKEAGQRVDRFVESKEDADDSSDDDGTEAEEQPDVVAPPSGLRTRAQELLRVALVAAAEEEHNFTVDELKAGHFVVFVPDEDQREAPASGGKTRNRAAPDARPFWIGQVYPDWEEDSGVVKSGVDRHTGTITVHNYTPYNLKKGAASSNNVAGPYGDYTPEYDARGLAKWTTCTFPQLLLKLSHLIPHEQNPCELSASDRSYFKIPKYAKKLLTSRFMSQEVAEPVAMRGAVIADDHGGSAAHKRQRIKKRASPCLLVSSLA